MAKPTIEYVLVCDHAYADPSGKASAIGIFTTMSIPSDKVEVLANFAVHARIGNSDEVKAAEILIEKPNGEVLSKAQLNGNSGSQNLNLIAYFNRQKINLPGKYTVSVSLDGVRFDSGEYFFQVSKTNDR